MSLAARDRALAQLDAGHADAGVAVATAALADLDGADLGEGLHAAALLVAIVEIERDRGKFKEALAAARRAVSIVGERPGRGADSLQLWADAHRGLASLEQQNGDVAEAEARLVRMLRTARRRRADRVVVTGANDLGVLYKYAGRIAEAAASYAEAQVRLESLHPAEPLLAADLLHNLAGLRHAAGEGAEGIGPGEKGLALRRATVGDSHPATGRDLDNLGACYHQAGRLTEAEGAYREALRIFEAAYGSDHLEVGMVVANLAVLASDTGDEAGSEEQGRRALHILTATLGPTHPDVGLTQRNLALALRARGRTAEADALAAQALATLSAALPAGHPHIEAAHQALAGRDNA